MSKIDLNTMFDFSITDDPNKGEENILSPELDPEALSTVEELPVVIPEEDTGSIYPGYVERDYLKIVSSPPPSPTSKIITKREENPTDYSLYFSGKSDATVADAPWERRVGYGMSREQTILGNIWDAVKAKTTSVLNVDTTYLQALSNVRENDLAKIYEEYPEFRGVGLYDEDLAMIGGRLGVALLDPITLLVPWTKVAKAGKIVNVGVGAGFGAADVALWGHVQQQEIDLTMVGVAAAVGGSSSAASHYFSTKFNKSKTKKNKEALDNVAESIEDADPTIELMEAATEEITDGPVVSTRLEGDYRPIREIIKEKQDFLNGLDTLPLEATNAQVARAHQRFLLTGKGYRVRKETLEYVAATSEKIVAQGGSKFIPDPKVAAELSTELQAIGNITKQIEQKTKNLKKLRSKKGTPKNKAEKKTLKSEIFALENQKAALYEQNYKQTLLRTLDSQDLVESIFETAQKEGMLAPDMMQLLIRESTRPVFGALGGLTASTFFTDQDSHWGYNMSWMVAGAGLMHWQKLLQKSNISKLNMDTGLMEVDHQWRKMLSRNYQKFMTSASASTKLDSLGGVGKQVANLLFDRPGGATLSVESKSYISMTEYYKRLAGTLGTSIDDQSIRKTAGEILHYENIPGYKRPTVGYKGIAGDFKTGLTQEQLNEVRRIVPLLKQQRDDLAQSVTDVGIDWKKLDNYGMPQLFNSQKATSDPDLFKKILTDHYKNPEIANDMYEKMFLKNQGKGKLREHFDEDRIINDNYSMRPLLNHFEKTRFIRDPKVRLELAKNGFINLDVTDVFGTYAEKTIKIREFAKTFGPNGEFITEAFNKVDKSFKSVKGTDAHLEYKNAIRNSVNAFFGKYGNNYTGHIAPISFATKSLVALANMTYLTRVGVTSLADFVGPWKATSAKASVRGITGRFQKGGALHKRAGIQYDSSFELELSALMAHSVDPLQTATQRLNIMQRGFFQITQLKRITEAAGKYAFDVGAYRAFDIAKDILKKPKITKALSREIKELGLQEENLTYISKFKSAEEAFDDDLGKQIIMRAGQKAMDRDRLVPKVGNRLLFTQHRDPFVRSFGQFLSWTQAKSAQTNALMKRIEDGDMKMAVRMLGTITIGNGAVQFLRDAAKPSFDAEKDYDPRTFAGKAADLSGDLLPWWGAKIGSAWKYGLSQGGGIPEASSAAISYAYDFGGAWVKAGANLAADDPEGAAQDIVDIIPLAHEINNYLKRFDLPHLEDKANIKKKEIPSGAYDQLFAIGGEVDVPNAVTKPEYRENPYTPGMSYVDGAGGAFRAEDDPLRRLGFSGGGSVDPLVRFGFSKGSSVLDAITLHHLTNLREGTYAKDAHGRIQTVYTMQVNDGRLNNGKPTLIPTIYDGKVVSEEEAIDNAISSKMKWPTAATHPELRKIDIGIHERFDDDLKNFELLDKRESRAVGSVIAKVAKMFLPRTIDEVTEIIPDAAKAQRAVDLNLTTPAFHGTLGQDIPAFKISEGDFGVHVGSPEQAWSRIKTKVEDDRMGEAYFERSKEAERIEREITGLQDAQIKDAGEKLGNNPTKALLSSYKVDPERIKKLKRIEELNREANSLQKELPFEEFVSGANILPVMVKANNPLRIHKDIGDWTNLEEVILQLLDSDLTIPTFRGAGKAPVHSLDHENFAYSALSEKRYRDPEVVNQLKKFMLRLDNVPDRAVEGLFTLDKKIELIEDIKDFIKGRGYDSIIYRNKFEVDYKGGESPADSLIIFDTNSIRLRNAEFDPAEAKSSDLLKATGGEILSATERQRKSIGSIAARAGKHLADLIPQTTKKGDPLQGVYRTAEKIEVDKTAKINWSLRPENKGVKQEPIPEVKEAAIKLREGVLDEVEYDRVVRKHQPVILKDKVSEVPTQEDVKFSLKEDQVEKGIVGENLFITDGTKVSSRLDISAYERFNTWVVTIHDAIKKAGEALGYGRTAVLNNVTFGTSPKAALKVATKEKNKSTFARIHGEWENMEPEEAYRIANKVLGDKEWTQVGFNPYRHSFFYDEKTMEPVISADKIIQIGKTVLAKNVKKTSRLDPRFSIDPKNPEASKFNEGGEISVHEIQSGETLSRIAKQYNTTTKNLAAENKIKNYDEIVAGQVLSLPVGRKAPAQQNISDKKYESSSEYIENRLGINTPEKLANFDSFFSNLAIVESNNKNIASSKGHNAAGFYQFMSNNGEDGGFIGSSLHGALNRLTTTYAKMKKNLPPRFNEIYKSKNVTELSEADQRELVMADFYERKGTDPILKNIAAGDSESAFNLYRDIHLTSAGADQLTKRQNNTRYKTVSELFKKNMKQVGQRLQREQFAEGNLIGSIFGEPRNIFGGAKDEVENPISERRVSPLRRREEVTEPQKLFRGSVDDPPEDPVKKPMGASRATKDKVQKFTQATRSPDRSAEGNLIGSIFGGAKDKVEKFTQTSLPGVKDKARNLMLTAAKSTMPVQLFKNVAKPLFSSPPVQDILKEYPEYNLAAQGVLGRTETLSDRNEFPKWLQDSLTEAAKIHFERLRLPPDKDGIYRSQIDFTVLDPRTGHRGSPRFQSIKKKAPKLLEQELEKLGRSHLWNPLIGMDVRGAVLGTAQVAYDPKKGLVNISDTHDWNETYTELGWTPTLGGKSPPREKNRPRNVTPTMLSKFIRNNKKKLFSDSDTTGNFLEMTLNMIGPKASKEEGFKIDIDIPVSEDFIPDFTLIGQKIEKELELEDAAAATQLGYDTLPITEEEIAAAKKGPQSIFEKAKRHHFQE